MKINDDTANGTIRKTMIDENGTVYEVTEEFSLPAYLFEDYDDEDNDDNSINKA